MDRKRLRPIPRINIILLIVGTRGDVQPFIALGQALRDVGHRVRLATHETFRKFVRGNGLEFYPLAGDPAELMSFMVKNSGIIPSISSIAAGDLAKNRQILSEILESTWRACTTDDDETGDSFLAEAIIANPPSFGHIHCAHKLRIPLHIMFTMPWSPTTAFPHPLVNVDYSKASLEKVNMFSYIAIEMFTWSSMRDIVNNFRKETLALTALHTRQATFMMVDEHVPYTYCWSPSLVPKPNDWAAHINVSGFFFLKKDATAAPTQPKELLEFLGLTSSHRQQSASPPIYIGFGSITGHDSERLLKVVLEALEHTGYRAVLSGLAKDDVQLPDTVLKIGSVPHDWLFQHVSAVCHHGGAGTTAAGLRAGKPTIIVPFFGDQFFWGNVVEKNGAGPRPVPGKNLTTKDLIEAIQFVHEPSTKAAAEKIQKSILQEQGCDDAVRAFHEHLPLHRMYSDLEPTYVACYRLKAYHLRISRSVAQVLIITNRIKQGHLSYHSTRKWLSMYDNRMHIPFHGLLKHGQKGVVALAVDAVAGIKQAIHAEEWSIKLRHFFEGLGKGLGKGLGHLAIGCCSLYGEITDVLEMMPWWYDVYNEEEYRSRPYIADFDSGIDAALLSLYHGWHDGMTSLMHIPRTAYERHGPWGGIAGTAIAVANTVVKPFAGTLSSITWFCRGFASSVNQWLLNDGEDEEALIENTLSIESAMLDASREEAIRNASEVSGFSTETCEQILAQFDQIKERLGPIQEP